MLKEMINPGLEPQADRPACAGMSQDVNVDARRYDAALLDLESLDTGMTTLVSSGLLVDRLRAAGIRVALCSSAMKWQAALGAAALEGHFDIVVDGHVAAGRPDPALLLETAKRLGVPPDRCVVIEDARTGVTAGRHGGFGMVVGVASGTDSDALHDCGADFVVTDVARITVAAAGRNRDARPHALRSMEMLGHIVCCPWLNVRMLASSAVMMTDR
ncbi:hypothetical protein BH10ACT9_BH10ACT9_27750 [soil metagenome]